MALCAAQEPSKRDFWPQITQRRRKKTWKREDWTWKSSICQEIVRKVEGRLHLSEEDGGGLHAVAEVQEADTESSKEEVT